MQKQALLTSIWLLMIVSLISAAQLENRAGLVVRFGDDRVETFCVSFADDEMTGRELLTRAGLGMEVEEVGMGAQVCRIDDVGCGSNNCFCECRGGSCTYWSYWRLRDSAWQYSATGASITVVQNGDVHGWSWGPGSVSEAISPPAMTFEEICGEATVGAAAPATSQVAAVDTADEPAAPSPTPPVTDAQEDGLRSSYAGLGILVLVLAALGVLAFTRRRG